MRPCQHCGKDRDDCALLNAPAELAPVGGQAGGPFEGAEIVAQYTRAQAIEDGVLVDVSSVAKEAGFGYPVALTRGAWELAVNVPEGLEGIQDEAGRLWDVLSVLRWCIKTAPGQLADIRFPVKVRVGRGERSIRTVNLKGTCGPGDRGEPVITIMLPSED